MSYKRTALFYFLAVVATISAFAKKQSAPLWVYDINAVYNEKDYLARLGSGSSEDLARIDALKYLADYFDTKIHSVGIASRSATTGENPSYSASAVQTISVQSDAELFGVEYNFYRDKKKLYYCLAFINKDKYWMQIQLKIENKKREFEKYYDEADALLVQEPILAKKYFTAAQNTGREFAEAVYLARLVVGERANIYSNAEKKVSEIAKRITDAESATAIFMDIQGDYSNMAASKIKSLFEGEGYNFTKDKRNCSHVMKISIERNQILSGKGTEYEAVSVSLTMILTLENEYLGQNLFSFSTKTAKSVAFNQDVALRFGYENLCKNMEKDLIRSFLEKILEK